MPRRHSRLPASCVSPLWGCRGYAQSGRLRPGNALPVAVTDAGAALRVPRKKPVWSGNPTQRSVR